MTFFRGGNWRWLASIPIISGLIGCTGKTTVPQSPQPSLASSLGAFRLQEVDTVSEEGGTKKTWLATAMREEKVARFRIELVVKEQKTNEAFAFTKGAIVREDGSDNLWFLAELVKVLEAKEIPGKVFAVNRLEFNAAILGLSLTRQAGPDQLAGSFTSNPPGSWIAMKVFVADGEGEFFLNLDPTGAQGEFSIKDSEYGDIVIRELAKVFLR